jgi:protein gp37
MGAKTEIPWTDSTWNPTRGCSMAKGSEKGGCLYCYAARLAARDLPGLRSPTTGKSFARILNSGPRWTGKVELIEKALSIPLYWKKPRRIFVNSMSDLFHESLSDEDINRVFSVMVLCQQHTFQILTKRPERMLAYVTSEMDWTLPNVHLGVSVEDQATADARIPILLQTPAAKRFVSYEPALNIVSFKYLKGIDQLIIGGESGPSARPFDLDWVRDVIQQCRGWGVAPFFKQAGANVFDSSLTALGRSGIVHFKDRKGADWSEWPEDLRVREFPL